LHKDYFCHRGKSQLGIGIFIHELAQGAFDILVVSVWLLDFIEILNKSWYDSTALTSFKFTRIKKVLA